MNKERYIRQTLLDAIGEAGQQKLLEAHIVVVGCGGLGSIAAPYLAGAGVGRLTLIDGDFPHVSNLHRQVFFDNQSTQKTKAQVLADHIKRLNPEIKLTVVNTMLTKEKLMNNLLQANVLLECTDNIQVKYMANDYCAVQQIPMVYGAIHKYDGYVSFFENKSVSSIHLRDIFAEPNDDIPSCSEVGVMGTLAGVIGLMQANEAIKYITNAGKCLIDTLLTYNILHNEQMKLKLKKTFTKDMKLLFQQSSYIADQVCETYECTIDQVMQNRMRYKVVSILEDHEHQDIDAAVNRMPLSEFEIEEWESTTEEATVFYCMSGVRSGTLVNQLLLQSPDANVYSLRGGLRGFLEGKE
ncbi:MAG: HesA/MoeB/ThiF family protein [Bacteroidota bacterium]